jgi:WD40 repeat protein
LLFFVGVCWCATSSSTDEVGVTSPTRDTGVAEPQPQTQPIAVAISPDGKILATAHSDQRVTLQALDAGMTITRQFEMAEHAWAVAFAPSGRWLATGGFGPDVIACELSAGGRDRPLGIPIRAVSLLEISPDEQALVAASEVTGEIIVWDLAHCAARLRLHGDFRSSRSIALTTDGRILAWADRWRPRIEVWDLRAAHRKIALKSTDCGVALALSADGSMVAGAGRNGDRFTVWDTSTGQERRILDHEIIAAKSVAFSPNGRLLAAFGDGSLIRVWDLATGRERLSLPTKSPFVLDFRFSRDSSVLVACESPSGVEHWNLGAM